MHLGFGAIPPRSIRRYNADILPVNMAATWGHATEVNLIGGEQQIADLRQQDRLQYTVAEMSADAWTARAGWGGEAGAALPPG
ncbi:hypothetical protein LNP17_14865 [Klebsiella variicola subsp. variicola]|nr:hypothetical protein [Klebsiella variicola subsp. variicola]